MYVVTVLFVLKPGFTGEFHSAMLAQAQTSLDAEPGCLQFDVCLADETPNEVFLYEVYRTPEDFEVHLASEHFRSFDARVSPWIAEKRVKCLRRIET